MDSGKCRSAKKAAKASEICVKAEPVPEAYSLSTSRPREPMHSNKSELATESEIVGDGEGDGERDSNFFYSTAEASEICVKAEPVPEAYSLWTSRLREPMHSNKIELATESEIVGDGEGDGERDSEEDDETETEGDKEEDDTMGGIYKAPYDIENPKDSLLKELHNLFRLSPLRCIYRVPERLRRENKKAYTPQVVSIGPLHHGKPLLKAMEEHKIRYLQHFLSRTRGRKSLSDYIKKIKRQERRLRLFYAESIKFGSDEFVRIVLVDAAFVIEFLLGYWSKKCEDDYIFNKPEMLWDVRPDLRLLENQLPFFILQDLFNTICPFSRRQLPSLLQISYDFFKSQIDSEGKEEKFKQICSFGDVQHFVDLLRILYLPLKSKTREKQNTTPTPNVTELRQAGVEFAVGTGSDLFDIKFSNGILEIPKLTVNDTTDLTLRNILAYEQCHHREENHLTNYVFLMMYLVKTPKDVELLVEKGIIENWLGDTQKVSTLLHDLGNGMMVSNYHYAPLCEELHNYCSKRRHKWMANLRQKYFNTPWSTISVVAAVILLILTFIQTVCSIISVA